MGRELTTCPPLISWFYQELQYVSLGSHTVQQDALQDHQSRRLAPEPHVLSYLEKENMKNANQLKCVSLCLPHDMSHRSKTFQFY